MSDPKLNKQIEDAFPEAKPSGGGSSAARLSQSPRAIREGNAEPDHFDGDSGSLGMDEPSKSDGVNDEAWKHQGDRYQNKYW